MTAVAFGLILLSIFLHVGWNLISKKSQPSAAFYLLTSVTSFLIYLPCAFFAGIDWGALGGAFWGVVLLSIASEILYFIGLFKTYRCADISLAYPMVRALPVLMVAGVTSLFGIGKPLAVGLCQFIVMGGIGINEIADKYHVFGMVCQCQKIGLYPLGCGQIGVDAGEHFVCQQSCDAVK